MTYHAMRRVLGTQNSVVGERLAYSILLRMSHYVSFVVNARFSVKIINELLSPLGSHPFFVHILSVIQLAYISLHVSVQDTHAQSLSSGNCSYQKKKKWKLSKMEREEESSSSSDQHNFFHKWINLQQEDLSELIQYQTNINEPESSDSLSRLIEKNIQHFREYTKQRSQLSQSHASEFFAPSWCSSLENSLLWIAGCRPSLFIRLIYALTGLETDCQLSQILGTGDHTEETRLTLASGLSPSQLTLVDNLHMKTVKEEDKLTSRFASLHEEIADQPMVVSVSKSRLCELDIDIVKMLDEHEKSMAIMIKEADKLRMNILKEVIDILTPLQAVEFLATSKKLHLCMHEWGKKRDEMRV